MTRFTYAVLPALAFAVVHRGAPAEAQIPSLNVPDEPSPQCSVYLDNIKQFRSMHGRAPDIEFYYSIVGDRSLTSHDQFRLRQALLDEQEPPISLDDLRAVLTAQRDSIRSFLCEYEITPRIGPYPSGKSIYAFDGNRLLLKEPRPDSDSEFLESYDGTLFYSLITPPDGTPSASISREGLSTSFFRPNMPLCRAMLFNMELTGSLTPVTDIPEYMSPKFANVFERPKTVGGVECVLVSTGVADAFLDPERGFSVMVLENYDNIFTTNEATGERILAGRRHTHRTELSDHEDFGNGLWLPRKIVHTIYEPGAAADLDVPEEEQLVTVVSRMEVNPELPDSFFSDFFPDDAFVADGPRGLAYLHGQRASINELLKKRVESKSGLKWLVIANLAALLLAAIAFWMRRRKVVAR